MVVIFHQGMCISIVESAALSVENMQRDSANLFNFIYNQLKVIDFRIQYFSCNDQYPTKNICLKFSLVQIIH